MKCSASIIFLRASDAEEWRTSILRSHAAMDNVALGRYLKARNIKVESFNMINQDYAWGQDSKKDFTWTMEKLFPTAKPGEDQLPKFGAGQYGTEISALMAKPADVTHSSLWGGDLQAFILQAGPRGLFKRSQVVFSAADAQKYAQDLADTKEGSTVEMFDEHGKAITDAPQPALLGS